MSEKKTDDKYLPCHYSQNFDDTIIVLVGPEGEEQRFTVHKGLICASSKFFKAACSKQWVEGKEKVVRLPEIKEDIFQAYIVWVYAGKVAVNKSKGDDVAEPVRDEYAKMFELYLLGDVLDDLLLRNAVMRNLVANKDFEPFHPRPDLINHVWDSTLSGSLLRKLIIDQTIGRYDRSEFEKHSAKYPKDLLRSIAVILLNKAPTVDQCVLVDALHSYLEPEVSGEPDKIK